MEIIRTNKKIWSPRDTEKRYYEHEAYTTSDALPDWWNEDKHALKEKQGPFGKSYVKYCIPHQIELPESGCPKCK